MPELLPHIEAYFESSGSVAFLRLDNEFCITRHNPFFARALGRQQSCVGIDFCTFLLPESVKELHACDITRTGTKIPLNFRTLDSSTFNMKAMIFRLDEGCLVIAEGMILTNDDIFKKMTEMTNEITNMARELRRKNRELVDALDKINVLSGIIPICCHCREIRDDKGYWSNLEKFISDHSEALFSHSICDKCMKKHYPELFIEDEVESEKKTE